MKKGKRSKQRRFWQRSIIKNKEMLQSKARENYQNLSKEQKNKKHRYTRNPNRKLFIENELSEEEKKRQYALNLYNDLSKGEKGQNRWICAWKIEIFLKKKNTKSINVLASNIRNLSERPWLFVEVQKIIFI